MESLSSDGDRANTHEDHMSKPSTNHPGKAPVRKDWWEPTSICDVSLDTPDGFLAFEKKSNEFLGNLNTKVLPELQGMWPGTTRENCLFEVRLSASKTVKVDFCMFIMPATPCPMIQVEPTTPAEDNEWERFDSMAEVVEELHKRA